MKYAWVCAHCGNEDYFSDKLPDVKKPPVQHPWVTLGGGKISDEYGLFCGACYADLIYAPAYIRSPIHDVSLPSGGEARPEPKPGDGAQDTGDNSGDNHDPNLVRKVSEQHLHNNDIDEGEKRR